MVTVTAVEVPADLSHAKVFDASRRHRAGVAVIAALQHTAGYLRSELAPVQALQRAATALRVRRDSIESACACSAGSTTLSPTTISTLPDMPAATSSRAANGGSTVFCSRTSRGACSSNAALQARQSGSLARTRRAIRGLSTPLRRGFCPFASAMRPFSAGCCSMRTRRTRPCLTRRDDDHRRRRGERRHAAGDGVAAGGGGSAERFVGRIAQGSATPFGAQARRAQVLPSTRARRWRSRAMRARSKSASSSCCRGKHPDLELQRALRGRAHTYVRWPRTSARRSVAVRI